MDRKEQNQYKKELDYMRTIGEIEKLDFKSRKASYPKYRKAYNEKLVVSGFHITHSEYELPIWKGFNRDDDAIEKGVDKKAKSHEKRKQLDDELQKYIEIYPNATKDDKKAMQHLKKIKKKFSDVLQIREDNERRKINKLKSKIQANFDEWTHFITLSFKQNLVGTQGIKEAREQFKYWTKKMKKLYPDFLYIYVIEFQQRGGVHFHTVCRMDKGKTVSKHKFKDTRKTWEHLGSINIKGINYKYDRDVGKKIKEATKEELRELSANEKVKTIWSVGSYLTSYLKKGADDVLLFGSKMYGSSSGLKEEIVITDKRKIDQFLKELGTDQLKEKQYVVKQKQFQNGVEIETDAEIKMTFYNKLIPKDND